MARRAVLRRFPLASYFPVVYGLSLVALVVIGLASLHERAPQRTLEPLVMFPVMVVTVGLAGVGFSAAAGGNGAVRDLFRSVRHWRVPPAYCAALIIPPACLMSALLLLRLLVSPAFEPGFFPIGIAFGVIVGWTGFGLRPGP